MLSTVVTRVPRKTQKFYGDLSVTFPGITGCQGVSCEMCPVDSCFCHNFDDYWRQAPERQLEIMKFAFSVVNFKLEAAGSLIRYESPTTPAGDKTFWGNVVLKHLKTKRTQQVQLRVFNKNGSACRDAVLKLVALTNVPLGLLLGLDVEIQNFLIALDLSQAWVQVKRATVFRINLLDEKQNFYLSDGSFNISAITQYLYFQDSTFLSRIASSACVICLSDLQPGNPFCYIESLASGVPQAHYCHECIFTWVRSHGTSPTTRSSVVEQDILTGIVPRESAKPLRLICSPEKEVRLAARRIQPDCPEQNRSVTVPPASNDAQNGGARRFLTQQVETLGRIITMG